MIEYASTRTGDPADVDAAAKQVQLLPCSLLYTRRCVCCDGCGSQAVEQDDPSILDAATARNNAMWPVFIIANLNRLNSYDTDCPVCNVMCRAHGVVTLGAATRRKSRRKRATSALRPPTAGWACSWLGVAGGWWWLWW
jgi:hypothetical protein